MDFYWGANGHAIIANSRDIELFGNKFEKDKWTAPVSEGGQGAKNNSAAVFVNYGTTDSLIANNIFSFVEVTAKFESAPIGNVYAYNYSHDLINEYRDAFPHGNYPSENLFEGNYAIGRMGADDYWGPQGPNNIWFRNRALGSLRGLTTHSMDSTQAIGDSLSFIGNVATNVFQYPGCNYPDCGDIDDDTTNFWAEKNRYTNVFVDSTKGPTTTYISEGSWCTYTDNASRSRNCEGFVGPYVNTEENTAGHFPTGYDGKRPPSAWSSFKMPASLFLTARPDWWCGELPWPAIGADVDDTDNLSKIPAQRRDEGLACTVTATQTQTKPPPSSPVLLN